VLSYRHGFHAGNFADVHKHVMLVSLLEALQRKERGITCVDTHAGAGAYFLADHDDGRPGEWRAGVERLIAATAGRATDQMPAAVSRYLALVQAHRVRHGDASYPGSPLIAAALLRPQDRAILMELHTTEAPLLKRALRGDGRLAVHAPRDAREGVSALLPPATPRGLVLIDPSYERADDYAEAATMVAAVRKRWSTAVIAVWYPLLGRERAGRLRALHAAVDGLAPAETLRSEIRVRTDRGAGLCGSGVLVLGPPWPLVSTWPPVAAWLQTVLREQNH
jgi:23S rRNA (adenine2030-N6)-methyltransferase